MNKTTIWFNGRGYPARELNICGYGDVVVSVGDLSNELIGDDGSPVSAEAERVDEEIFFYVDDSDIGLDDAALVDMILNELI